MTAALEPPPAFLNSQPPARPKRRWGRVNFVVASAVVALIVVLVVGLVLFVNASTKDAQKVSDQLVTAIQAGDGAKAYALTSPSFRAVTTQAQVSELAQRLSKGVAHDKRSPDGKAITASTDAGKVAVLTYTMKGLSGKPVYFKTMVHKENGGWRVLSFRARRRSSTLTSSSCRERSGRFRPRGHVRVGARRVTSSPRRAGRTSTSVRPRHSRAMMLASKYGTFAGVVAPFVS